MLHEIFHCKNYLFKAYFSTFVVNYILTTNIDLPFLQEYLTQTPEYLDLATRYATAIDALYDAEGVASDRVTRVTAVRSE